MTVTPKKNSLKNKNEYRTMFVSGDGDAKTLQSPLNIIEMDKHLERLLQDLYDLGQGINTANKDIRDTSGVALRYLYADLDMDCLDWGSEYTQSIRLLLWFIIHDLKLKRHKDFSAAKFDVIYNTDVIINESETIQKLFCQCWTY